MSLLVSSLTMSLLVSSDYEPAGVLLTLSLLVASSSLANASFTSLLVCLHLFL